MKIKKLLFATSFDDLRLDALKSLLKLKMANLDHVVLLNVIKREKVAMRRGTGYQKKAELKLREKANIRFIDWAETLFEEGLEVGVHIVVGDFISQVVRVALMEEVDLVVIGLKRKTKIEGFTLGSDFKAILERVDKPVLVYKYEPDRNFNFKNLFENLLLAKDWESKKDDIFIEFFLRLKNIISSIDVIHVAKEKNFESSSAMAIQKTRKIARKSLDLLCEKIEKGGINAKSHVYVGDAMFEIEKAAKECGASMIVVGFSKKVSWRKRWIVSIGGKVVEKTIFPTLLMPLVDK